MKKVFSILAIGAMMLGMVSCGGGESEPGLKNFTVKVEKLNYHTVQLTITAPTEKSYFAFQGIYKRDFSKEDLEAFKNAHYKPSSLPQGTYLFETDELYPATEYLLYLGVVDEKGNIAGDVETFSFKTEDTMHQEVSTVEIDNGYAMYSEAYKMFEVSASNEGGTISVRILIDKYADKSDLLGHFTTNDMVSAYSEATKSTIKIYSIPLGKEAVLDIYRTDFTGTQMEDGKHILYEGWFDAIAFESGTFGCLHVPFKFTCQPWEAPESEE